MTGTELPRICGIGFKEWSGVCDALAVGDQILILRKGGIAEEAGGFAPEHRFFWLYPTLVHETQQGLRIEPSRSGPTADAPDGAVSVRALAAVERVRRIGCEDDLDALEPFHVWTSETVHKRFRYRAPGLWALVVRVYTAARPTIRKVTPDQIGCKSWVEIAPPAPTHGLAAAIGDEAWRRRLECLPAVLR